MPGKKAARKTASKIREAAVAYPVVGSERPIRKNYYLYQSKIDAAREVLGVATETEAIDVALGMLIYGDALARGTEAMAGEDYLDVLGIAAEVPKKPRGK